MQAAYLFLVRFCYNESQLLSYGTLLGISEDEILRIFNNLKEENE